MTAFRILPGLTALFLAAPAMAAGYQDLDALDARIASTLGDSGTPVPIDRRIRLAQCPEEPEISPPSAGALAVRCPALGWKIRVAVSSAEQPAAVAAEILVRRGDLVELVVRGAGFSASAPGTALDEGVAGKTVRVKIPTSPTPVSAVVVGAGMVAVQG
jgi:flagella basal body P-ring formation protein FlgA